MSPNPAALRVCTLRKPARWVVTSIRRIINARGRRSYSQSGEDLILEFLLSEQLEIRHPTYLDLGANHPVRLNNTYLFYQSGSTGVCVEADPRLCSLLRRQRKRDKCISGGVTPGGTGDAEFFVMSVNQLSTFSAEHAYRLSNSGTCQIQEVLSIPLLSVNEIIRDHCGVCPNLLCIDIEGLDEVVLADLDFGKYRPEVVCVETVLHAGDGSELKNSRILQMMTRSGYRVYADTYVNTIFVDEHVWNRRRCAESRGAGSNGAPSEPAAKGSRGRMGARGARCSRMGRRVLPHWSQEL